MSNRFDEHQPGGTPAHAGPTAQGGPAPTPQPRRELHIDRDEQGLKGAIQRKDTRPGKVNWDMIATRPTVIKVIGVGGGGCNAVQSMVDEGFEGVEFYAINTDYQALQRCRVPNRIQIGENLTLGSGAGSMPSIGEQAAREAEDQIREILTGADMVFITAGMGGGTGTGAAPVVAEVARTMNILNVAIVTKPFQFEGAQRMRRAIEGIRKMQDSVDTMIVIMNDKLMEAVGPKTPLTDAFRQANSVLASGIRAISDLIATPGLINVDFQDVRTIMGETGGAVMGYGECKGENRAVEAVRKACSSPLQEKIVIDGARGVLINITGPPSITMHEIHEATSLVYEAADPEANVIFGVVIDENMNDAVRVTIIATGFGHPEENVTSGREERLRPRVGQAGLGKSLPLGGAGDPGLSKPKLMADDDHKPAILKKNEGFVPKIDFSSPENPMSEWKQPQANGGFGGSDIHHATNGEISGGAQAVAQANPDDSLNSEDPFETPALARRRRQRFFE